MTDRADDLVKRLREAESFNLCHADGSPDEAAHRDAAYEYAYLWREAATALESLQARIEELEATVERFSSIGVEAYDIACEEMEAFQKKRAKDGKEIGAQGSLVDWLSWLYSRIEQLERENAELLAELESRADDAGPR